MNTITIKNLVTGVVCLLFVFLTSAQVFVNEYSVSNLNNYLDNYGKYEDWFELYNAGSSSVSLGGYHLSDKKANPTKWQIPSGVYIPAGGYLIFWASGRDEVIGSNRHTNFKLSQTKSNPEYIVLADPSGVVLDEQELLLTQLGHSRGRTLNGGSTWSIFTSPTLGTSNNNATGYLGYTAKPTMDVTAGFYPSSIVVTINEIEPDAVVRYTLDGREPLSNSPIYTTPLTVSSTTVVKARSFSNNIYILPGLIEFNTYFINETHVLPVVSVSASSLKTLVNGNQNVYPNGTCEYFNEAGERTTFGRGEFNSHGQDSWVHDQRSIDFIMRDEMGYENELHDKLLPMSKRNDFQRIILRASGDDNYPGIDTSTHGRDLFVHTLSQVCDMSLDVRKVARVVMYVDGEYWGVYAIREKVDDHDYTEYYYDQGKYDLQFLMTWGNTWTEYGAPQAYPDWMSLYNYILSNDMSVDANYDFVSSQYDVTSLTDYVLINSWVVCSDWLNWNTAWWRGLDTNGTHQKWGYILWDEDATFGHYINYTGIPSQTPDVDPCFPEGLDNSYSDPEGHIKVLNKLMENETFNQYYISRYADLLNDGFKCENMMSLLDSLVSVIDPEMQRHIQRWGGSYNQWLNNVQKLKDFITARCDFVPEGLNDCYSLEGPYPFAVNVDPPGVGNVQVNSLLLTQFPWAGEYYGGIDILLEATSVDTLYVFDHWEVMNTLPSPDDTSHHISMSISTDDSVVAVFKPVNTVGIVSPELLETSLTVSPNPFTLETRIQVESFNTPEKLYLFDIRGVKMKEIKSNEVSGNEFVVNREGMANGIYFFQILDAQSNVLGIGKLVVE